MNIDENKLVELLTREPTKGSSFPNGNLHPSRTPYLDRPRKKERDI